MYLRTGITFSLTAFALAKNNCSETESRVKALRDSLATVPHCARIFLSTLEACRANGILPGRSCNWLAVMVSIALRLEKATKTFHNEPNVCRCSALEIHGFGTIQPSTGTDLFSITWVRSQVATWPFACQHKYGELCHAHPARACSS